MIELSVADMESEEGIWDNRRNTSVGRSGGLVFGWAFCSRHTAMLDAELCALVAVECQGGLES